MQSPSDFNESHFRHKYLSVCDGHSYHALLLDGNGNVVGNISIIPYRYKRGGETVRVGLGADVFIREAYRTDPLALRRMYKKLTGLLTERGIVSVMAVPNATAYPYWKNVVKWKDVGRIRYWGLPVRVGNVLGRFKFLNPFSLLYAYSVLWFSSAFCLFKNTEQRKYRYEIEESESFLQARFTEEYEWYNAGDLSNCFRIVNENGVRTAYLIYSRQGERMSFKSLLKGVASILRRHKVDLLLFVGPMGFFQTLLVRIPRKFEPKALPLTCDLLTRDGRYEDMLLFENWNFGLLNYDVR